MYFFIKNKLKIEALHTQTHLIFFVAKLGLFLFYSRFCLQNPHIFIKHISVIFPIKNKRCVKVATKHATTKRLHAPERFKATRVINSIFGETFNLPLQFYEHVSDTKFYKRVWFYSGKKQYVLRRTWVYSSFEMGAKWAGALLNERCFASSGNGGK